MKDKLEHISKYRRKDGVIVDEYVRTKREEDTLIFEMEPFFRKRIKVK